MTNTYIVTGTLTDANTVKLDEPLPISTGKVRVVVEGPSAVTPTQSWSDYFAALRARQTARGHVPRSAAEIDAQIREERESWDE
ncbi:unnamed protein product [Gemmataceae bacterium]|nr:unnamed protein product [Gemmataceae bacterium]VTT99122.1 unnamed protein product [Gemmataceae bacterium]